jgi:hypothetical protein
VTLARGVCQCGRRALGVDADGGTLVPISLVAATLEPAT